MLNPEKRALLTDLEDRLIELAVEKDNATGAGDQERSKKLQAEIERLRRECDQIKNSEK